VDDAYVQACASILFNKPRQSQQSIVWPPHLIDSVRRQMRPFPFLRDYV
jgi:hypothetical protein